LGSRIRSGLSLINCLLILLLLVLVIAIVVVLLRIAQGFRSRRVVP
jgi:hypothetical protein